MTYDRSTTKSQATGNFRRAALAEINAAISELADARADNHARVHRVRKRCKRLRSLYRLVRLGFSAYEPEIVAVRSISRRLSELRDVHVRVETSDALASHAGHRFSPTTLFTIRQALVAHRDTLANERDLAAELKLVQGWFIEVRDRVGAWRLDPGAPDCVRAGLSASYERARSRFAAISRRSSAEQIHDWRKRTKDHRLQLDFLDPAEPGPQHCLASLDLICRKLGEHHDLHVLKDALTTLRSQIPHDRDFLELMHLIKQRQSALLSSALARGRITFAEPTGALYPSRHDTSAPWWHLRVSDGTGARAA